jgi:hypothetical protein
MSYKPEVFVEGKWYPNGLVFQTETEAKWAAQQTFSNWTLCQDCRAVSSTDKVNAIYDFAKRDFTLIKEDENGQEQISDQN